MGKEQRRERIKTLIEKLAMRYGDFVLSSGQKSKYYFDGKMATTDPEAATLIAEEIFEALRNVDVKAVGGLTIGAALMAPAISLIGRREGRLIPAFVVRDQRKEHGTKKFIEGYLPKGPEAKVAIIDDVITGGGSVLKAIDKVEEEGCEVVKVIVLLDRHQGGSEEVRRRGYDFVAILHADSMGRVTVDEPSTNSRRTAQGVLSS
ncbi:MAG: orotate phosphoribosyltransferase [Dehalococcoidia bacterium]|nr:orotate phosphoribosyltransferase [Dehalococcoidia bacterium]